MPFREGFISAKTSQFHENNALAKISEFKASLQLKMVVNISGLVDSNMCVALFSCHLVNEHEQVIRKMDP